ncbi:MAG: EscU/YscU/HrcU family type III secretion system export apparatus switch protein [Clostridia bacterium]|jgi:flagellar biosynthesis protein|nr:EscU/YscU/HrcU family type III secretion system export apparatus switch protein [Clostridia bacterium]
MKKDKKIATAISYSPDEKAPKVVAKGKGIIADKIIEKAEESKVEIIRNEELARELINIDIDKYIPEELYEVVAEILIFVTNLDKI